LLRVVMTDSWLGRWPWGPGASGAGACAAVRPWRGPAKIAAARTVREPRARGGSARAGGRISRPRRKTSKHGGRAKIARLALAGLPDGDAPLQSGPLVAGRRRLRLERFVAKKAVNGGGGPAGWSPDSWRSFPHAHEVSYPDAAAVESAVAK